MPKIPLPQGYSVSNIFFLFLLSFFFFFFFWSHFFSSCSLISLPSDFDCVHKPRRDGFYFTWALRSEKHLCHPCILTGWSGSVSDCWHGSMNGLHSMDFIGTLATQYLPTHQPTSAEDPSIQRSWDHLISHSCNKTSAFWILNSHHCKQTGSWCWLLAV